MSCANFMWSGVERREFITISRTLGNYLNSGCGSLLPTNRSDTWGKSPMDYVIGLMITWSLTRCRTLLRNSLENLIRTIFYLGHFCNDWPGGSPSHLFDDEDFILVELLVKRELSSLSECLSAALVRTLEWFLTCVNVGMFLQILA